MYDLIIVGAGPAGMTAAIYAAREKLKFLVISKEYGGQMAKKDVEIENYPGFSEISAQELISRFREQIKTLQVHVEIGEVRSVSCRNQAFSVTAANQVHITKTILIATGADPKFLNVPGEKELVGRGVGYCTTCDGPLFAKKDTAVIGGGNSALEAALFLARYAKKVYIVEYSPKMRGSTCLIEKVKKTGIVEIITGAKATKITGEKFVRSLEYREVNTGKIINLPVEGIFIKIGHRAASHIVKNLVELNDRDEIKYDYMTHQTKTPGLFVAGDVSEQKYKQIIVACGEGAKAAMAISEYLANNEQ